jgi:hypothetical protein
VWGAALLLLGLYLAPSRAIHQKICRITREAVNGRGDDNIPGREGFHQLLELRPVGGRAGDILPEHFFAPGGRGACYAKGMMGFLSARQIRVFDYPRFAEPLRECGSC